MKAYLIKYFVLGCEQVIFSFSNFFYLAVVARRLPLAEFAELSLGYTCYLILIGAHHALICDPIIATGISGHNNQQALLRRLWVINVLFCCLALGAGCALVLNSRTPEAQPPTVAALACLFFSFAGPVQFIRRIMHVRGHVRASAVAATAYATVLIVSAWVLPYLDLQSHFAYTAPFIFGNLIFLLSATQNIPPKTADHQNTPLKSHFRAGYSFLVNNLLGLATTNIYPFIFVYLDSPEAVASYRLMFAVIAPFAQLLGGISGFITPRIAVARISQIETPHLLILTLIVLAPLPLALAAIWFGRDAATLIFGAKYAGLGEAIPVALISTSFALALSTVGMWLRANHRLGLMQAGGLISATITGVIALPICSAFGITGAFVSLALAHGVAAAWVTSKGITAR
ncbi:lipopolysaccharide biosynthesis protein [Bradyrhizobium sp. RDT46]|uniref:lipopolysaccharide biosynthesis protein n=1 Tax=Bradyrhizobium sp. RDT46 TaxID=3341829 RepID=UPI0035C740FB